MVIIIICNGKDYWLIKYTYIYTPGHNNTYTSSVKGANWNEITMKKSELYLFSLEIRKKNNFMTVSPRKEHAILIPIGH